MKVLLLKDVYNLGRAGDVKKVADGFGRNFLIPQKLAMLATAGALKQAGHIKKVASEQREVLNQELSVVAERLEGLELIFPVKAGETGKLYGSITTSMIAEAIKEKTEIEIDRRQVDSQPIKVLGVHSTRLRLTMDLLPEIKIIVHREGEPPESVFDEEIAPEDVPVEDFAELQVELDAIDAEAAAEAEEKTAKEDAEVQAESVDVDSDDQLEVELETDADEEIAEVETEVEDPIAELVDEVGDSADEEIAEVETEVEDPVVELVDEVGDSADEEIAEVETEVEDSVAELVDEMGDSADEEIAEVESEVEDPVAELVDEVGDSADEEIAEVETEVEDPIAELVDEVGDSADEVVEEDEQSEPDISE